jgi:hypothetical protein
VVSTSELDRDTMEFWFSQNMVDDYGFSVLALDYGWQLAFK